MWAGWVAICNANDNTAYRTKTRTQAHRGSRKRNGVPKREREREERARKGSKENRLPRFRAADHLFLATFPRNHIPQNVYKTKCCTTTPLLRNEATNDRAEIGIFSVGLYREINRTKIFLWKKFYR